uniref:Peptidase_M13 domain-containing protein n=1 Tax=Panagrellus redivivus TaxID=6233 RepID=A0A7E4V5V7_PANRE
MVSRGKTHEMVNTPVKWLYILPILFLAIFPTSQGVFADDVYKSIENPEAKAFGNRVCTNKECVKLAAMLLQDRNDKINPCEDFGAYVCGKFKINNDEKTYFHNGARNIHRKLKRILESTPEPNEKPWYNFARSFYKKCLDTTSDVYPGLRDLLNEIGGWPAPTAGTSDWTEFDESFEEYIANIHRKYRVDFFFKVKVFNVQLDNRRQNIIYVTPTLAEFNSSHLEDLSEHGLHLNPKLNFYQFKYELFDTLTFHNKNKVLYNNRLSQSIYGPIAAVKVDFPNFDFEKYFKRLYNGITRVDPETIFVFESPEYFRMFHELFRPRNRRRVANYASILVLQRLLNLPKHHGEKKPRENSCIGIMYSYLLIYPVSQMYIEKHVDHDAIQKVTEMVTLIKEELRESLKNASWLDDKTRASALFKMDKMQDDIGYPKNLFNDTYVEDNWNFPPSPSSESYYQLVARIERKLIASSLLKITQPRDTISWLESILMVNAYYYRQENEIVIQQGLFQLPFHDKKLPDYINYATMGAVVSHEIMHGFDNKGRFHDAFGENVDWWDNTTSIKYDEKTSCYVKQYTAEGVDGLFTLGENIADNVGFKLAYGAYKRLLKKRGVSSEPALPAFEKFTLEKVFFIAYNHEWCSNGQIDVDPNDPHPPPDTRVKMVARNSKHFSKAFNCEKTSPMNPEEKCSIW